MDFATHILHLIGSGAVAFISARNIRDPLTRPDTLAAFQLAESGSVPFLEALRDRATAEGDTWLADQLNRHANDERRHGQIFAQALKQLNKQTIEFKNVPQTTSEATPEQRRRSPFFEAYFKGYSSEMLKPEAIDWMVFIASTHILEFDASQDFVRMANVLPETDPRSLSLKKGMLSIAQDETRHAAYLRDALYRRMPILEANAVIDQWRTRKVNALLAMVGHFLQREGASPSLTQDSTAPEASSAMAQAA